MSDSGNPARSEILGNIRRALGVTGDDAARRATVAARLANHAPNLIPERAREPRPLLLQRFRQMLEGQSASVFEVDAADQIPAVVAQYLRGKNLPLQLRKGEDARLAALPWANEPAVTLTAGRAGGEDPAGLSHATAGIAETGTLVLTAGPANPTTLNFLPPTHIVVIDESTIVGAIEDVWTRLRVQYGAARMPRVVNFISGPSRTADIEQVLTLGAHGPVRLAVIILRAAATDHK